MSDIGISIGLQGLATYERGITRAGASTQRFSGQATRGLGRVQSSFSELRSEVPLLDRALRVLSNPLVAAAAGVAALAVGVSAVVDTASGFEDSLNRVGALLGVLDGTEQSTAAFEALNAEALRLGSTTEFSAIQAGESMQFLARAGFDANEVLAATENTLALATIGQLDLARASDISSDILRQFNLEAGQLGSVVDILAKTSVRANTDVSQLNEAFKYLGPTAAALGVSLAESSAVIGVLSNSSLKGSLATRALGTSLTRLAAPTGIAKDLIEDLGIQAFDSQGEFVGLANLVENLEKSFDGLTDQETQNAITKIFGAEAIQEFNVLLSAGSDEIRAFTKELEDASAGNGEFSEELRAELLETYSGSVKLLTSAFEGLKIALGTPILDALKPLVAGLAEVVGNVTQFIEGVKNGGPALRTFQVGLTIAATALALYNQQAILSAVRAIPALIAGIRAGASALAVYALNTNLAISAQALYITATNLFSRQISLATAAQRAFNIVFASNPVGLIVTLLGAAVTAYFLFADSADEATGAQQRQAVSAERLGEINDRVASTYARERVELDKLFKPLVNNTSKQEERAKAIEAINKSYGEYLPSLLTEKSSLEDIESAYKAVNAAIIENVANKVIAQEAEGTLAEIVRRQLAANQEVLRLQDEFENRADAAPTVLGAPGVDVREFTLDRRIEEVKAAAEKDVSDLERTLSALAEVRGSTIQTLLQSLGEVDFAELIPAGDGEPPIKPIIDPDTGPAEEELNALADKLRELGVDYEATLEFDGLREFEKDADFALRTLDAIESKIGTALQTQGLPEATRSAIEEIQEKIDAIRTEDAEEQLRRLPAALKDFESILQELDTSTEFEATIKVDSDVAPIELPDFDTEETIKIKYETENPEFATIPEDQTVNIGYETDTPEVLEVPDQEALIRYVQENPDLLEIEDQEAVIRYIQENPDQLEVEDQEAVIRYIQENPELLEAPDQEAFIRYILENPELAQVEDQQATIRYDVENPELLTVADQEAIIRYIRENPELLEVEDQEAVVRYIAENPDLLEIEDQEAIIRYIQENPELLEVADQEAAIRYIAENPELAEIPDQEVRISFDVEGLNIPEFENKEVEVNITTSAEGELDFIDQILADIERGQEALNGLSTNQVIDELSQLPPALAAAAADIVLFAQEPGASITELSTQVNNLERALKLLPADSPALEVIAEKARELNIELEEAEQRINDLLAGIDQDPIAIGISPEISEDFEFNIELPDLSADGELGLEIPQEFIDKLSSLEGFANRSGVGIEFLKRNFTDLNDVMNVFNSKGAEVIRTLGGSNQASLEFGLGMERLAFDIQNTATSALEEFGATFGRTLVDNLSNLDEFRVSAGETFSGVASNIFNLAKGTQTFGQTAKNSFRLITKEMGLFGAVGNAVTSSLTTAFLAAVEVLLTEVPKLVGVFLLKQAIINAYNPAVAIPLAISGLALVAFSGAAAELLKKFTNKGNEEEEFEFETPEVPGGGFVGASQTTSNLESGNLSRLNLSALEETQTARSTQVDIFFDGNQVTDAFTQFFNERELSSR